MRATFGRLGPLGPLLVVVLALLMLFGASRAALVVTYWARLRSVDGVLALFPIGLHVDLSVVSGLMLPALALSGLGLRRALVGYLTVVIAVAAFLEAVSGPFLGQYDSRPNRLFFEYLRYPREVCSTVLLGHPVATAAGIITLLIAGGIAARGVRLLIAREGPWSRRTRFAALPLAAGVLFLGLRGNLDHRGLNPASAAFSNDHLANELALDSSYSLAYALYSWRHEVSATALYGALPRAEAITRVHRQTLLPESAFADPDLPFLHHEVPLSPRLRPHNLVIILEESLGAEFVGSLGGQPLTPRFDALADTGVLLTRLYATGTRTVRGIEATVSGMLPTPGTSVVKLGLAQRGFFTLADLLRRRGYATSFLYGGEANFDNMASFFRGNGFEQVSDGTSFSQPVFRGVWGVSDEDLFARAHDDFLHYGDHPFFALLLTTSNHDPWEFPAGHIVRTSGGRSTRRDAIRYADHALGDFFDRARTAPYFADTVFLVVADHDTRVYGAGLVPVSKFHIPGLILAPGLPPARLDTIASQIDLAPTLLDLIGLPCDHPMVGHDLLRLPPGMPGHAFLQYEETQGYRVGDEMVVLQPDQPPRQFHLVHDNLIPAPLDPELARDAVAHAQVAEMVYREQRHRLPPS